MTIAKPFRVLLPVFVGGSLAGVVGGALHRRIGGLALLAAALVLALGIIVGGVIVDAVDLWLRRRTRDPVWLMTSEGRAWLSSPEGVAWAASREKGPR